jgi:hypothetical protein
MNTAIKVPVWEYERGWGSKIDDWMVCLTQEDAAKFVEEFNSINTDTEVPDWYMVADDSPLPQTLTDKEFKALKSADNSRQWLSSLKETI